MNAALVRRWTDRWNAYWFPTTPTLHLAICRIVAVAAQLFWFFPSMEEQQNRLVMNSEFIEPQLLIRAIAAVVPREVFFTLDAFAVLYWVTMAAGVAALVGLFTRTSLFVFALGTWIFIAHLYSYGDRHHTQALFCIFLMLLVLAPSGERLSVDALIRRRRRHASDASDASGMSDMAIWPLKVVHVLLAMTYFSTGMSKLLHSGLRWLNGYTLQGHTFGDALERGHPLGIWLAGQHEVAVALSVFTILLELFFFVSLFLSRLAPLFFLGALAFQVGLYLAAGYDFFQHMVLLTLLLFFLYPEWWRRWLDKPKLLESVPA
ncbi:MAG TPA: HTTM domain-containing protein [Nonomuraea sp.]|nr:HTTM domain-containing protein [Nonomuraea sp.]